MGTGPCPVLTKDNGVRKELEPRPGADSPALPALGAPFPADPRHALNARHPLLPVPVLGGSSLCPGRAAPSSHLPTALFLGGITSCPKQSISGTEAHPVLFTPVSGAGSGCQGHVLREQEETSGFPRPSRGGPPPLPEASSLQGGAEPQESWGQEVSTFALLTFRFPEALTASRPLI